MWRKGKPHALLVGMQIGAAMVENSMKFPQKLKMELSYKLAIPLLSIYPMNPEIPTRKDMCTPMLTVVFTIAKITEAA